MSDDLDADVLIIGAGLSGIGAACHLTRDCPDHRLLILEARRHSGGTWDLFRYPGIRSDSDMHTLGYDFKPWRDARAIADGPSILRYLRDTARDYGVDRLIRFGQQVLQAAFDTGTGRWTMRVRDRASGRVREVRAGFLLSCAGYYSYQRGYEPDYPGRDAFAGPLIHPQFWPQDFDHSGKRIVVIGSGATAMTLVPTLAQRAASVTMLQRSPTWVIARASRDRLANALQAVLPDGLAYRLTRWKNTLMQQWLYRASRRAPRLLARFLQGKVRREIGGVVDVERDFAPRYDPWDERLCLLPDGDLFDALRSARASIVTAQIAELTADGIRLTSGEVLPADAIISATGLQLNLMGDVLFSVDGEPVDFADTWTYKGMMFSGVPNLVSVFGYVNASWTLRADLIARWTTRLLRFMRERSLITATPVVPDDLARRMPARPWIDDFSPGYMRRVMHRFPRQGDRAPWINPQDYRADRRLFLKQPIDDGSLHFTGADCTADGG
jgi:monooxygenase